MPRWASRTPSAMIDTMVTNPATTETKDFLHAVVAPVQTPAGVLRTPSQPGATGTATRTAISNQGSDQGSTRGRRLHGGATLRSTPDDRRRVEMSSSDAGTAGSTEMAEISTIDMA